MKLRKASKNFVKQTLLIVVLFVLGIVSVSGSLTLINVSQKFGQFELTPTELGVALHQNALHTTYLFNAYNDYIIDQTGNRSALVPFDDSRYFVKTNQPSFWQNLLNHAISYFAIGPVGVAFANDFQIIYDTTKNGDSLLVTRKVSNYLQVNEAEKLGATMLYERDDFVFDKNGTLFTENSDPAVADFNQINGTEIKKDSQLNRRPEITGKSVYIVNPHIPGVLVFVGTSEQTIFINKDFRLIEAEQENIQQNKHPIVSKTQVLYFANLNEALAYE